ncbi:MAG: MaoC family dehydratase N-terminal domain-containing protein [Herminiimonas sp.]|nr:MaoC family dehydratase N-terminal domain-containing protein [Herminiimonas sp.]
MTPATPEQIDLQAWVGKTETLHDLIDPRTAAALAATLDRPVAPATGTALPPLWHWTYFWSVAPQAQLGADGHPERGGFLPPIALPRRMWAGGRLRFERSLTIGAAATRTSRILSVTGKSGKSGDLAFVTVQHEVGCNGAPCFTEEHDIVYRGMPPAGTVPPTPPPAPTDAVWKRLITPDPVLLFRYSALTFNGHRIHYDRSYATGVEGYPGLVVHGPLIATLLVELLQQHLPQARLASFDFRAVSPLFDTEPFTVCGAPGADGRTVRLWAANARGGLAMQAEATFDTTTPGVTA